MNNRIKALRTALEVSQDQFGAYLGITGSGVSNLESGRRGITDQMILSICRAFRVNEEWLRTGSGEMFVEDDANLVDQIVDEYSLDSVDAAILSTYVKLPAKSRGILKGFILSVAQKMQPSDAGELQDIIFTSEIEEDLSKGREQKKQKKESS